MPRKPREKSLTLFLLKPSPATLRGLSAFDRVDTAQGFVVRTENEKRARKLAGKDAGDEGAAVWQDTSVTTCEILGTSYGVEEIVLRDYRGA